MMRRALALVLLLLLALPMVLPVNAPVWAQSTTSINNCWDQESNPPYSISASGVFFITYADCILQSGSVNQERFDGVRIPQNRVSGGSITFTVTLHPDAVRVTGFNVYGWNGTQWQDLSGSEDGSFSGVWSNRTWTLPSSTTYSSLLAVYTIRGRNPGPGVGYSGGYITYTTDGVFPLSAPSAGERVYVVNGTVNDELPRTYTGTAPHTYNVTGAFPTGLSFNASTRSITGTPSTITTTPVSLTYGVTDSDGDTDSETFTVAVNPEIGRAHV